MKGILLWILWNCWLALIPAILGYVVGEVGTRATRAGSALLWAAFVIVACVWMAFLPNTCYLITEWRHFLDQIDRHHLYERSGAEPQHLFDISLLALFYLFYSGFGVLALTLAVRPVERLVRLWRFPFPLLAPFLFIVLSLGVYLGLVLRFNSWDVVKRPAAVWAAVANIPHHPLLYFAIIVFGFLLWGLYEGLDIWADGMADRWQRLRRK